MRTRPSVAVLLGRVLPLVGIGLLGIAYHGNDRVPVEKGHGQVGRPPSLGTFQTRGGRIDIRDFDLGTDFSVPQVPDWSQQIGWPEPEIMIITRPAEPAARESLPELLPEYSWPVPLQPEDEPCPVEK